MSLVMVPFSVADARCAINGNCGHEAAHEWRLWAALQSDLNAISSCPHEPPSPPHPDSALCVRAHPVERGMEFGRCAGRRCRGPPWRWLPA